MQLPALFDCHAPELARAPLVSVSFRPYALELHRPWQDARGSWEVRRGWILRLETPGGTMGYGDCAPLPAAGTEAPGAALEALRRTTGNIANRTVASAASALMDFGQTPAVRCALECALLDLLGRHVALPVSRLLCRAPARHLRVNAMLGPPDAGLPGRASAAVADGFRVLKIKLGIAPPDSELAQLTELAAALAPEIRLRLDVNGAWSGPEALQAAPVLRSLPLESLEEPASGGDPGVLRELQARMPWPVAVDESLLRRPMDMWLCDPPVRRLVLKPMVLGGLIPARDIARRARAAGLEVVVTTTVDSAVGVCGALQLAAAVDQGVAHGLATSLWLRSDTGEVPVRWRAEVAVPRTPGLGLGDTVGAWFGSPESLHPSPWSRWDG